INVAVTPARLLNLTFDGRVRTQHQPARKGPAQLRGSLDLDMPGAQRSVEGSDAPPHFRKSAHRRRDAQIDLKARRLEADLNVAARADEPKPALMHRGIAEADLYDGAALRHQGGVKAPMHRPHEPARVQVPVADIARPALPPTCDSREHRTEFLP